MVVQSPIASETIEDSLYFIREKRVIFDRDLATLYGVETKALKQAVKRNIDRFPEDFMFELTKEELENWRSQFVTSNSDRMGLRYSPYVFTENGVAMLSSVLKSKKAVQVNIQIMRVFTAMRKQALHQKDILKKLEEIDKNLITQNIINKRNDKQIKVIFEAIRHIIEPPADQKKTYGFVCEDERSK